MKKACLRWVSLILVALFATSCATVYDSQGKAHQVVRPEAAVAGVILITIAVIIAKTVAITVRTAESIGGIDITTADTLTKRGSF